MMKLPMQLALLALAAAGVAAAPPERANLGLCSAQAECIDFTIRKTDGTTCELTGNCGVEVCMILDTEKEGCAKEGPISHLCAASDSTGCAAYDDNGDPLTGKGGSDYCDLTGENDSAAFDGKCEPSETQTRIVMCQEAEPGKTLYWALKDSTVADTGVYDYTSNFTYFVEGTVCESPLIQCSGNTGLQCAAPRNDMYESTRVWSYEIPANDGGSCDLCGGGSALVDSAPVGEVAENNSTETPEWLWLACGRGRGGCGDTTDIQDRSTSRHEVRCCAGESLGDGWKTNGGACSGIWHESDLIGLDDSTGNCFHSATYEEAVAICEKNNAEVCTKQQIEDGCVKGSGCGHDADLIWSSTEAPEREPRPTLPPRGDDDWLWLSCGRPGRCGSPGSFQAQAKEKHEVRCCSEFPNGGWKKNPGCSIWTESNLAGEDGEVTCFHDETYADAQTICALNNGYVCTKEEVESGCAAGSGCGHDADPIWTSSDAPEREPRPTLPPRGDDDWLWLSCGRPGGCGSVNEYRAQAKESHEVRCCSEIPVSGWKKNVGCSVWTESDLVGGDGHLQCFHSETYADAKQICEDNGGYVCTKEEVDSGCARGSGCGHDADLIWTSTDTTEPEPIVFPNTDDVDPNDWIWLACGRGKHLCAIGVDIQIPAHKTAELRCCSPVPVSGWKKNGPTCDVWHESDLIGLDGREQCFHDVTYAQAQEICAHNGGHVCTKDQVEAGCAKGSGCGHDGDLIWTGALAPERSLDDLPHQDPVDDEEWLWLACGKGGHKCGIDFDVQARADEVHEVRCCSDFPIEGWRRQTTCQNWHQSKLIVDGTPETCVHDATYEDAQTICRENGGYVCSQEQVKAGCAKGSGCGHDADFIWTSTGPAPPRPSVQAPVAVPDNFHLFLACGAGEDGCGGDPIGVARPTERHEVRCCSPFPISGWKKGNGDCSNYHESELVAIAGLPSQCFDASTYAEAQTICYENNAYVCTASEVLNQCAKGSGCGHDGDLIWTSSEATAEAIATYNTKRTQAESISGVCIEAKGRISGDPHFTTFDNYRYDCQGHGEFVIAMSTGSDPLAIHGQFVRVTESRIKPTITRAVAMKVIDEVPAIQVTAPPQKINGMCPFTFTIGREETVIPSDQIVSFLNETYSGAVNAFTSPNGKNIIFTYPDVNARIQITAGGGGNRCVLNTNLCLTPGAHGGADNIVGLLGSPDGNSDNDWMNRDGTITSQPAICGINNPTSSESKHCKTQRNIQGHEWCMDNWCVGHADNSLWGEASHAEYNECENRQPDTFFENVEEADPAIVEACEGTADPDGCVIDTIIAVEAGETIADFVETVEDEDRDANLVENLGQRDPSEQLEGWTGPVLSETNSITIEDPEIVLEVPETPPGDCPVCRARGWGDPHIVTFDGLTYDVHVKGELTFLKSTDPANDFTIQARTVPVRNHPRGPAVTSGVLVHKTGEPTIQVSLAQDENSAHAKTFTVNNEECPVQLFVDGQARHISSGSGSTDATVQVNGNRIVVEYLNLQMRMDMQVRSWRNECHFSVTYFLADCPCDGSLVGILGQPDGEWTNDWHEHDGTPVDIPRSRRKRRGREAYDYSLTWCLAAEDSHFEYEPEMSHEDFDQCTGDQGDENFDVDIDKIIDDATPEVIEKCTTDNVLDEGCVLECEYLGEGACDEYVEIVQNTATAEIPETPDETPDDTPDTTPDDTPDSTPDTTPASTPDDTSDPGTSDNSNTAPADIPETPEGGNEPQVSESSGSLGDPHFKTWVGEHFEYHGQCDMILAKDHNFADGIGFEVQIRTKLVRFWSYIKRAAIRIGDDILEVEGVADPINEKGFNYWVNFEYNAKVKTIGGFPLTIRNNKAKKRWYEIDLSSKFPGQKIVISTFREFVRVDFKHTTAEAFGNAVGMMGNFKTGNLLARDGKREIDDFLELGNEWQLLPADDMLFHDKSEPQFPKRCFLPEDPQGERRRRLGESTITVEEAEASCAKVLSDKLDIKDCVYDILATQDLTMAGAF